MHPGKSRQISQSGIAIPHGPLHGCLAGLIPATATPLVQVLLSLSLSFSHATQDSNMSVDLTTVRNVLGPLYLASQFNTALFAFECIYMVKVGASRVLESARCLPRLLTQAACRLPPDLLLKAAARLARGQGHSRSPLDHRRLRDARGVVERLELWHLGLRRHRLPLHSALVSRRLRPGTFHRANFAPPPSNRRGVIAYVLTTSLTGCIVQAFLAQRLFQLTKSTLMLLAVAPFWLGALGAGLTSAVFVALFPGYNDRAKLTYPVRRATTLCPHEGCG